MKACSINPINFDVSSPDFLTSIPTTATVSPKGFILSCTDQFGSIVGYENSQELIGKEVLSLGKFDSPSAVQHAEYRMRTFWKENNAVESPWIINLKSSTDFMLSLTVVETSSGRQIHAAISETAWSEKRRSRSSSISHSRSSSVGAMVVSMQSMTETDEADMILRGSLKRSPKSLLRGRSSEPLEILLVDSNKSSLLAMSSIIINSGHLVSTASSGRDALNMFEAKEFHTAYINIHLSGGMSGVDLVRFLSLRPPDAAKPLPRTIAMVDDWNSSLPIELSGCGFEGHMCTPMTRDKFQESLNRTISSHVGRK